MPLSIFLKKAKAGLDSPEEHHLAERAKDGGKAALTKLNQVTDKHLKDTGQHL